MTIAMPLLAVLLLTLSNVALSYGLRRGSPGLGRILQPVICLALLLVAGYQYLWTAVVTQVQLSSVLPLMTTGYLLNALLVGPLLGERVSRGRWAGTSLVFLGVLMMVTR